MKNEKYSFFIFKLIVCFVTIQSYAQLNLISEQNIDFSTAVKTLKSGNWSDISIWSDGQIPGANTDVIIDDNHTIYIDVQGNSVNSRVDLCKNLKINQSAVLQMGHNQQNFLKDLKINGSILCNGTFSAGRTVPNDTGDGHIYDFNSRIFITLRQDKTYISGSGYFNPKTLSISANKDDNELIIDHYNIVIDDNFEIKSFNRAKVVIEQYAYLNIKKSLGITGSTYRWSSDDALADLIVRGIVITNDVGLFTKNNTNNASASISIENRGSLYTQSINEGELNIKSESGGFLLDIKPGGLFRLGEGVDFNNLTINNPNFTFQNNGELKIHYSETLSSKSDIDSKIDEYDPNLGKVVPQIKDVFGASHISGWYNFTDKPYLLEGLDRYKEFGATSLKTTVTSVNGNMESAYPFNQEWPKFNNLKEVAQHYFLDSLFKRKHIKTHTFWATTNNKSDLKKGPDFNHEVFLDEEQQFYDLTKYLLATYGDTGKTFVYQNWEGDWILRDGFFNWEKENNLIPDDVFYDIESLGRMFRAHQRGVERARKEFPSVSAKVLNGIEFNKLLWLDNGVRKTMMDSDIPCVVADVIPRTRLDLCSWSAYDSGWSDEENPHGHAMWKGIEIASYYTNKTQQLSTKYPVQIGEFAINENPPYNGKNTAQVINERYGRYVGLALALDIPNFYLWNLHCSGTQRAPEGFFWENGEQYDTDFLYEWMDGKWLIEPDGSWGVAAQFLMNQWSSENVLGNNKFTSEKDLLQLYPNPTNSIFKISELKDSDKITILDYKGKIVNQFSNLSRESKIHIGHLAKGMYFVLIKRESQSIISKKLVIN